MVDINKLQRGFNPSELARGGHMEVYFPHVLGNTVQRVAPEPPKAEEPEAASEAVETELAASGTETELAAAAVETKSLEPTGLFTPHVLRGKFYGCCDMDDQMDQLQENQAGRWSANAITVTLSRITGDVGDRYDIRETPWGREMSMEDSATAGVTHTNVTALVMERLPLEEAQAILLSRYGIQYPPPPKPNAEEMPAMDMDQ